MIKINFTNHSKGGDCTLGLVILIIWRESCEIVNFHKIVKCNILLTRTSFTILRFHRLLYILIGNLP